jgi:hypothetical protein
MFPERILSRLDRVSIARPFQKLKGVLDLGGELTDFGWLPVEVRIPVHPPREMSRLVAESLVRVVEPSAEVGEEQGGSTTKIWIGVIQPE